MRATVTVLVDIDLDAWQTEYGSANAATALTEALTDLREAEHYFATPKWSGLVEVVGTPKAIVDLDHQPSRRR